MVKLIFCWNFARLSLHSGRLSLAKFLSYQRITVIKTKIVIAAKEKITLYMIIFLAHSVSGINTHKQVSTKRSSEQLTKLFKPANISMQRLIIKNTTDLLINHHIILCYKNNFKSVMTMNSKELYPLQSIFSIPGTRVKDYLALIQYNKCLFF